MAEKQDRVQTPGEGVKMIDAAMDHLSHAWNILVRDGVAHHVAPKGAPKHSLGWPPDTIDGVGTAGYHMAAAIMYAFDAQRILGLHVVTDGQLCPYGDCSWDCGFNEPGWYRCPHCKREFWVRECGGDVEDWHCYMAGQHDDEAPERPTDVPYATDLGPSWASPEDGEDT